MALTLQGTWDLPPKRSQYVVSLVRLPALRGRFRGRFSRLSRQNRERVEEATLARLLLAQQSKSMARSRQAR